MPGCTPIPMPHQAAEEARRLRINPHMALCRFSCVPDDRRRWRAQRRHLFPVLATALFTVASQKPPASAPGTVNMWDEYNNGNARTRKPRRRRCARPERLARNHCQTASRFRSSHIDQVILLNQGRQERWEPSYLATRWNGSPRGMRNFAPIQHTALEYRRAHGAIQLEEIDTEAFTDRYGNLAHVVPTKPAIARGVTVCSMRGNLTTRLKPHDALNQAISSFFDQIRRFRESFRRQAHVRHGAHAFSGEPPAEFSRLEQCEIHRRASFLQLSKARPFFDSAEITHDVKRQ